MEQVFCLRFLLQFVRRQHIFWCHLAGYSRIRALIAFWCVFIGTLVLIIFTIATGGMKKIRSMSFVDGICLILAGIAYPLAYDFYGRAVSMSGSYAGYIFNLTIIVMMICSSVILKEKVSERNSWAHAFLLQHCLL